MAKSRKVSPAYVPLSEAVYSCIMDVAETEALFERYLHWGIGCYRDMNLDGHFGVKQARIKMTDFKAICLPDDCIDWTMLGVQTKTELWAFTNEENLSLNWQAMNERGELTPALQDERQNWGYGYYFYGTYNFKGEHAGRHFGLKKKYNSAGLFREDKAERMIYFKSWEVPYANEIYIEYISDCSNFNEVIMVHVHAKPVIEAWIHFKDAFHSTNPNKMRTAPMKREIYDEEYRKFMARTNPLTLEDISEALFDSYSLSPNYA